MQLERKGFFLKFKGIDTEAQAKSLVGSDLGVPRDRLPAPPEAAFYVTDLIGLRVEDEAGLKLGSLKAVYPTAAHDLYEIQPDAGPAFLVPAVKAFIKKIDLDNRRMTVHLIPGLAREQET